MYCFNCGSTNNNIYLEALQGKHSHIYYQCRGCGIVFEKPLDDVYHSITDLEIATIKNEHEQREIFKKKYVESIDISDENGRLYPKFQYVNPEDMEKEIFSRVNLYISRYCDIGKPLKIIEIGCATGFLLQQLKQKYPLFEVLGIEPSPVSVLKSRKRGIPITHGTIQSTALPLNSQDIVIIIDNLMLHENPFDTLKLSANILTPNGILIIDVKNINCLIRKLSKIIWNNRVLRDININKKIISQSYGNMRFGFSKSTITLVLQNNIGMEILAIRTRGPRQLSFENKSNDTKGLKGLIWRMSNMMDVVRDEQAWIEVCCRKKA